MEKWIIYRDKEYLAHHGIKGQKWGIRRYQNEDGSLTDEGKSLYLKKVAAANNQLKALKVGNKKAADYWQKKQDEIASIERKNKIVSLNRVRNLGANKVQYTIAYIGEKDYKKFVKESKKSIENGSTFLESLGLQTHSIMLDLK